MNLFAGFFPQTYSLALSKTPFNFNARIDIQKFNYIKKYTSTFGDHMQVHLKTATSLFKSIKKLWVNLKQVDSKSSHSKGSLLINIFRNRKNSANANWTNKRTCFKQPWISVSFKPNTLNTTHLIITPYHPSTSAHPTQTKNFHLPIISTSQLIK